ncbi:DNA mismatch repair protein MutS domain-containing protein [Nocardia nova SH22a]|uniref:DNA mismatch repair protein MutS domain-containing protein n=1 Tax=Nocardia nova SH22a TaxID=1415166 RepID=W5TLA0_9NOCA|nr:hypothetical protein [Nocardia nova]AHH19743.1 DNA mismatch repair protein MutS domain-containing protein [Nocardia nova SH22a]
MNQSFSILFPGAPPPLCRPEPPYFSDLNLGQVRQVLFAGRDAYDLAPVFHTPLTDVASVRYRHEVFTDLDGDPELRALVKEFAASMRTVRRALDLARQVTDHHEADAWQLHAAEVYVAATRSLHRYLSRSEVASTALRQFGARLNDLVAHSAFTELAEHAADVAEQLYRITYCLDVHGDRIRVARYTGDDDYEARVRAVFDKFQETDTPREVYDFHSHADLNGVESKVLTLVAKLYPDRFAALARFRDHHPRIPDELIVDFDREIQFYCAALDLRDRLAPFGLSFCLPELLTDSKDLSASGVFDLALADKLTLDKKPRPVVTNDVDLSGRQRVIVVTGPNQGGKTTFARAIGQLYHLAALGMPVPAATARIRLCDRLFTHFEREEDMETLSGKLEDELIRVHDILDHATGESVVVMNETFTSTTLADAARLGASVLRRMLGLDLRCVYVTFVDELSALGPATVSMVAAVDPADPAHRTFEVVRRPADGLAYAAALAEAHGLTYQRIKERMAS